MSDKPSRGKINYSKKLDALVEKFEKARSPAKYDTPSNWMHVHKGSAGSTLYGEHDTNDAIENGFEMAMRCPADKQVWSGYSDVCETRYYVYAADEADALLVWADVVKAARAESKKHPA
jgi:hypothetical protein